MAHASRTTAAARKRKLHGTRNQKVDRLVDLLRKAFPDYWTHVGDQFVVGVKDKENLVIIGLAGGWFKQPAINEAKRIVKDRTSPIYAALKEIYATLPEPASAKVTVQVGGMMPTHPRRQKLLLLLNAIESAFPWLKKSPGYGSTATAGGTPLGPAIDNSLLIHVDGGISLADLECVCRTPGKVHIRLKDVCDTTAIEDHDDEPLSPIHLMVNDERKTVTYASIFKGEGS